MSTLLLAKAVLASIEKTTPPNRRGWSLRTRRAENRNLRTLFTVVPVVLIALSLLLNFLAR